MTVQRYPDDLLYFAYGSNLDIDQKEDRTGRIREARRCRLPGYRFAFNKRGHGGQVFANIMPDEANEVWGVAYRCRPGTLEIMDKYEGVGRGHYRRVDVEVHSDSGERLRAITYVAEAEYVCPEGRPTHLYASKVLRGAEQHGLPSQYIAKIRRLAGLHTQ